MLNLQHPDTHLHQQQIKSITRGGRQAADDQAMEAYWLAIEAGCDSKTAAEVFNKTYIQFLNKKP